MPWARPSRSQQPADRGGSAQVQGGGQAACVHAQHYRLGATRECLSMRCSISAPTMPFRSVGSHQRTILFLSTALTFSFSFIQPSVTVERRRLPNAGNVSLINTLKRVRKVHSVACQPAGRTKESRYVQLERMLRIVDSQFIFDNDEGMQGQYMALDSCVTLSNRRMSTTPRTSDDTFCVLPPISAPLQHFSPALLKCAGIPSRPSRAGTPMTSGAPHDSGRMNRPG
ncbi:hypothetical protein EDB84DRAFT_774363 [Lactarius hengduanensis]|nr:hypothetical protein EDB84DRAFT_774363 [Lactarius hengduanensis]